MAQKELTAQAVQSYEEQINSYAKNLVTGKADIQNDFNRIVLIVGILALAQKGRNFEAVYSRLSQTLGKADTRKLFISVAIQTSVLERSFAYESGSYDYAIIVSSSWQEKDKTFSIALDAKATYDRIAEFKELLAMRVVYLPRVKPSKLNYVKDDSKEKAKAEKAKAKKEAEAKAKAESEAKEKAQAESTKLLSPETVTSAEAVALIKRLVTRLDNKKDIATVLATMQTIAKNI